MAYTLSKTNGGTLTVLNDGLVDTSVSSLSLIGKNVANFGDAQNENFVHLLENFAYNVEPRKPIIGQIWFNTNDSVMCPLINDGVNWKPLAVSLYHTTTTNTLVNAGGFNLAASRPGDFWFDSSNKQLHVVTEGSTTATATVLIGPESVKDFGVTKMSSTKMLDSSGVGHAVIQTIVNGEVLSIQSIDSFTQTTNNPVPGFPTIYRGITFKNFSHNSKVVSTSTDVALYGILDQLDLSFTRSTNPEHLVANWTVDSGNSLQFGTTAQSSVAWSVPSSTLLLTSSGSIKLQSATSSLTFSGTSLSASTTGINLGTTSTTFATTYLRKLSSGASSATAELEGNWQIGLTSQFGPIEDKSADLGSSLHRFNKLYATTLSAGGQAVNGTLEGTWYVSTSSNILPSVDLGTGLGTTDKRFNTIYTTGISAAAINNTISVTGSPHIEGNVIPTTNNTYDLGTSATRWNNIYATNVNSPFMSALNFDAQASTIGVMSVGTATITKFIDNFGNIINQFDADPTLLANSNLRLSSQRAVKTYVDAIRDQLLNAVNNLQTVPPGATFYTAAITAPTGYVVCDGANYPVTGIYANLFAAIGYTYGGSGGAFAVPDLRGQFIRGYDGSRGLDAGRAFGSAQGSNLGDHQHDFDDVHHIQSDGQTNFKNLDGSYGWPARDVYGVQDTGNPQNNPSYGVYANPVYDNAGDGGVNDNALWTIRNRTAAAGSGETRPTNVALLPIIKL
jgi:hypothetical protein